MRIAPFLLAAFVAIPLVEIALFVQVGGWIGLWPTLLAIVGTALAGGLVIRWQGIEVATKARARLDQGDMPVEEAFTGLCLVVAGLLLIVPGFFTDAVGALLLIPPARGVLYRRVRRHVRVHATSARGDARPPGDVIDADYEVVDDDPRAMPPPKGNWQRDDGP